MPNYVVAVVPPHWDEEMPLTFSEAQYQRIREQVESGTRVLLYSPAPDDAIIGQAQVHGTFLKTSEWPEENLGSIDASDPTQAYILPLEVVFTLKGPAAEVSGERIRAVLEDDGFPHGDERWRVITPEQYNALRATMP